jgi:hypothetical protein
MMTAFAVLLLSCLGGADVDDELPRTMSLSEPRAEASKWDFDLAPYGWLTSVTGSAAIRDLSVDTTAKFKDLFTDLKFFAALHGEAWHNDRLGILLDTFWVKTRVDATTMTGGDATLTTWLGINELALAFRFPVDVVRLDLLGGVRWVYLSNELNTPIGLSAEKHHNFLDPMFGMRVSGDPWEWLELSARIDAGGFGVGTALSGSIVAAAGFRLSRVVTLVAAYKALALKVEKSNWNAELRFEGPLFGIDFRF